MEWWNRFVEWLSAPDTLPVLFTAVVAAVAIIVSAIIASAISKAAVKRLIAQRDREQRAAAVALLIDAATEASVWNSLTPQEQVLADRAVGQADIHVRLLPVKGSAVAADWAAHQLAEMKRASATFGYELAPVIGEFRDRLLDWQERPGRAKKVFQGDLERWKFADDGKDAQIVAEQDAWVAEQHHASHTAAKTEVVEAPARLPEAATDPQTQKLIDDVAALDARKKATADGEAGDAGEQKTA